MKIVSMSAEHLDEIAQIERLCFPDPWSRAILAEELENACAAFLTALDADGAVIGYAGLHVMADEGYVANIAVRPEHRRQGVASALLDVFISFAKSSGLAFLTLEVRGSNAPALALYRKKNFRLAGRRRNYYRHPTEDAWIMTLELIPGTACFDPKVTEEEEGALRQ